MASLPVGNLGLGSIVITDNTSTNPGYNPWDKSLLTTNTTGTWLTSSGPRLTGMGIGTSSNPSWGPSSITFEDYLPAGKNLNVEGDASINGKLEVGGVDIGAALTKIMERLAILDRNLQLEERWAKLKALGEEYRKLEKEMLEQEEICQILKGKT